MDQGMIAYFDERFRETSRQIEDLRKETTQQIASLREDTTQQIASFREEANQRFERSEETARHTVVLLEDLRHQTQILAEGMVGLFARQDRLQSEVISEFQNTKEWFKPYYTTLDSRIGVLEREAKLREGNAMDTVHKLVDQMRRESLLSDGD